MDKDELMNECIDEVERLREGLDTILYGWGACGEDYDHKGYDLYGFTHKLLRLDEEDTDG